MDTNLAWNHWATTKDLALKYKTKLLCGCFLLAGSCILIMTYSLISQQKEPIRSCVVTTSPTHSIPDSCSWQFVLSDLSHRLCLLETAFKEQVVAREMMAQEVMNQSDSNVLLEQQLMAFSASLKQISLRVVKANEDMAELSSRLYSDECLGFLVLMVLVVQLTMILRTKLIVRQGCSGNYNPPVQNGCGNNKKMSSAGLPKSSFNTSFNGSVTKENSSSSGSKQNIICAITFDKSHSHVVTSHLELLLRDIQDDPRGIPAIKPTIYVTDTLDGLRGCPKTKLHMVFVDALDVNSTTGSVDSDNGRLFGSSISCSRDGGQYDHGLSGTGNGCSNSKLSLSDIGNGCGNSKLNLSGTGNGCSNSKLSLSGGGRGSNNDNSADNKQDVVGIFDGVTAGSETCLAKNCRSETKTLQGQTQPSRTELNALTIQYLKSMAGHILVIVVNDAGSKTLPTKVLYNSTLAILNGNENLQCLGSRGSLYSIWQDFSMFQLSHARKSIKSIVYGGNK